MREIFKMVSMFWIASPVMFAILRLANVVNVDKQNVTIFIVLSGISYIALFLNSDTK